MRRIVYVCATFILLAIGGSDLSAADLGPVITTTDGSTYVKGADGQYYPASGPIPAPQAMASTNASAAVGDGLDEVNAKRAARGLRPFIRDHGLTQAAQACAAFRAKHRLFGHTQNDFGFVPAGSSASSAGCAAYPAHMGWLSCCTYDNYTHAGAAWVTGDDGKRYMHLFVSHGQATAPATGAVPQAYTLPAAPTASSCPGGQCGLPAYQRGRPFSRR